METFQELCLFSGLDAASSGSNHCKENRHVRDRKRMVMNLDLLNPREVEGVENMPKVAPYNDDIPLGFVSYSERKHCGPNCGIHFYTDDYRFMSTWLRPLDTAADLKKRHNVVIAPDFSTFVDVPRAVNVSQLYFNRWTASYWQHVGISVIPSASWGAVDSFTYCFDGLPQNSIISIGHATVGRSKAERELYRLGVQELIRRKHPVKLIVYGFPLDFDPIVEVMHIPCFIQTKFRNK